MERSATYVPFGSGPDGTFQAEGVPVGRVAIRLAGITPPETGTSRINATIRLFTQRYLIIRNIRDHSQSTLEIDIGTEAVHLAQNPSAH